MDYLRHRFINRKQNVKTGLHIFTKIENIDHWKQKKKFFFSYFISEFPNVSYVRFFKNYLIIIRVFL